MRSAAVAYRRVTGFVELSGAEEKAVVTCFFKVTILEFILVSDIKGGT
jgi:hypothetical protein